MSPRVSRRRMLRLAALGGAGGILAACAERPATAPTAQPPAAAATPPPPVPATAVPTAAPPATVVPTAAPQAAAPAATAAPAAATLAPAIGQAASAFLDGLSTEARDQARFAFTDTERTRWHWTTPQGFPRNGLPLTSMSEAQRDQAFALLQASSSAAGLEQVRAIMALQTILGNDPLAYYVSVFGEPGGSAPWGWRWEGHHLSRNVTVTGDTVTMTPFFLGAWPTTTDAGLRAMPRAEDAARELVTGLSGAVREQAIFSQRTLTQHVTQNQVSVAPLDPVGVAYADLGAPQQGLVREIIGAYLGGLPPEVAAPIQARLAAADINTVRFGWAGPVEPQRPQYYRLQGPTFLLEFDNSRNGGTHIHSVWRDFADDFGKQVVG